MKNRSKRGMA